MSEATGSAAPPRVRTGIAGLDEVLQGGLFRGGVYIVMGVPGVGKTILGNQLAFAHARTGGRVVYATILSETHARLLTFIGSMAFYEAGLVGDAISYLNAYGAVQSDGLAGLLKNLRDVVREHRATLLVLDGMLPASMLSPSEVEYRQFVQQLQTWIELVGCTVVLLSGGRELDLRPEYTMVDGIIELEYTPVARRRMRNLTVRKLRGSDFFGGAHSYIIGNDGITVFPRIETAIGSHPRDAADAVSNVTFGRPGLDHLVGGALARCSSTLLLGANGSGKTTIGLHFLAAGLDAGEAAVHCSFYEDPPAILATADSLGLRFSERLGQSGLNVHWFPSGELLLDRVGYEVLSAVRRTGATRLFLDGLEAFMRSADSERVPAFFSALVQELRTLGVTTVFTSEAARLLVTDFATPFPGVSAVVDNLLLLFQNEIDGRLVRGVAVVKTRGRLHHREIVEFAIGPMGIEIPGPRRARDGRTGKAAKARRRRAR